MSRHRIHLRGPWDYEWSPAPDNDGACQAKSGTVTMPKEWRSLFEDYAGTAQFRRKFHRPTNLGPDEQVMIVFTEVRGAGRIRLNESPVGQFVADGESIEFEITSSLKSFNEIIVDISFDPSHSTGQPGGLFGVAALEIQSRSTDDHIG